MAVPYQFDVTSERDQAAALAAIGIGQKEMAAMQANRGDKSAALVGIGPSAPSQNPMQISATPAPSFQQPGVSNPPASASVAVPPPAAKDPMRVAPHANYIQPPDPPRPSSSGTVTVRNPMGL